MFDEAYITYLKRKDMKRAEELLTKANCFTKKEKEYIYKALDTRVCVAVKKGEFQTGTYKIRSGIGRNELAELCGIHKKNVEGWGKRGKIKEYYDGFMYLIPMNEVIRVISERRNESRDI